MEDIYENVNKYMPYKECKVLMIFDGMIADMINNKKLTINNNRTIPKKQENKHFFCFDYTISFCSTKKINLNSTHYLIMKIVSKV